MAYNLRLAELRDIPQIIALYYDVYGWHYPDATVRSVPRMQRFMSAPGNMWFIAERDNQVVGSVVVRYDQENLVAKASGAAVAESARGNHLTRELMEFGTNYLASESPGVEIVYATTRTVHTAAQKATRALGFKEIGIFPNVHKTIHYETHVLVARISEAAFAKRAGKYRTHPRLDELVRLVTSQFGIDPPGTVEPEMPTRTLVGPPLLEIIEAEQFVQHRLATLRERRALTFSFFPFHVPNMMVVSPDQRLELFLCYQPNDGHCAVIGGHIPEDICYTELLLQVGDMLRDYGARYIELIMSAEHPKMIESVLQARFIPSAFFPALRLADGVRSDIVVLSRCFEILDFQGIEVDGLAQKYLEYYYNTWKSLALNPRLMGADAPEGVPRRRWQDA